MAKKMQLFKKSEPEPMDPEVHLALREMAGWPQQAHQRSAERSRHRSLMVQRDHMGRIINSVELIEEDEHEQYTDSWGK